MKEFAPLITEYLRGFQEKGEPFLKTICNCKVPSEIILSEYRKLPPIERMPEKDKKELKRYVIDAFPYKTIVEKLDCAKIVYTIGTLL
jgi:hypothetical protein